MLKKREEKMVITAQIVSETLDYQTCCVTFTGYYDRTIKIPATFREYIIIEPESNHQQI